MSNDPSIFCFTEDDDLESLLARNREWADRLAGEKPGLFPALAGHQYPPILWIGCSDSRVPETSVLDLLPGEVFVHRNIANVLPYDDLSSLAVIQYGVEMLKVKHIIICGHTACGGVNAAMSNRRLGLIDHWLRHIRDVRAQHLEELEAIEDPKDRAKRLVELNIIAQVHSVKRMPNVQEAMAERGLEVHGVLYDVACGHAHVMDIPEDPAAEVYALASPK